MYLFPPRLVPPQLFSHRHFSQLLKLVGTSYGPSFAPAGATYLRPNEHGLAGLLSRHLFCSEAQWKRYMASRGRRQVVLATMQAACPGYQACRLVMSAGIGLEAKGLRICKEFSSTFPHGRTWLSIAGVPLSIFGLPLLHPESIPAKTWSFFMILV